MKKFHLVATQPLERQLFSEHFDKEVRLGRRTTPQLTTIVLDLKVGKVPVSFREDADGLIR